MTSGLARKTTVNSAVYAFEDLIRGIIFDYCSKWAEWTIHQSLQICLDMLTADQGTLEAYFPELLMRYEVIKSLEGFRMKNPP